MEVTNTPELEKLRSVRDQSQQIGAFIEWLNAKDYVIGRYLSEAELETADLDINGPNIVPIYGSIEKLLAEYFEIDLIKVEEERSKLLEQVQESHTKRKVNGNKQ